VQVLERIKITEWTAEEPYLKARIELAPDIEEETPEAEALSRNLIEVAKEIGARLASIFLLDANGKRPVYGGTRKFQEDPHWKDYILFYEYFHGDNGAGLGASHQTGWTGVIARSLDLFARLKPIDALQISKGDLAARMTREQIAGKEKAG